MYKGDAFIKKYPKATNIILIITSILLIIGGAFGISEGLKEVDSGKEFLENAKVKPAKIMYRNTDERRTGKRRRTKTTDYYLNMAILDGQKLGQSIKVKVSKEDYNIRPKIKFSLKNPKSNNLAGSLEVLHWDKRPKFAILNKEEYKSDITSYSTVYVGVFILLTGFLLAFLVYRQKRKQKTTATN